MIHFTIGETCREEGQVRLMNGTMANEGRVEICMQGVWGSICRNNWNNAESAIVCEQLGFQSESKYLKLFLKTDEDLILGPWFWRERENNANVVAWQTQVDNYRQN